MIADAYSVGEYALSRNLLTPQQLRFGLPGLQLATLPASPVAVIELHQLWRPQLEHQRGWQAHHDNGLCANNCMCFACSGGNGKVVAPYLPGEISVLIRT
jgi:hypothetical protein